MRAAPLLRRPRLALLASVAGRVALAGLIALPVSLQPALTASAQAQSPAVRAAACRTSPTSPSR